MLELNACPSSPPRMLWAATLTATQIKLAHSKMAKSSRSNNTPQAQGSPQTIPNSFRRAAKSLAKSALKRSASVLQIQLPNTSTDRTGRATDSTVNWIASTAEVQTGDLQQTASFPNLAWQTCWDHEHHQGLPQSKTYPPSQGIPPPTSLLNAIPYRTTKLPTGSGFRPIHTLLVEESNGRLLSASGSITPATPSFMHRSQLPGSPTRKIKPAVDISLLVNSGVPTQNHRVDHNQVVIRPSLRIEGSNTHASIDVALRPLPLRRHLATLLSQPPGDAEEIARDHTSTDPHPQLAKNRRAVVRGISAFGIGPAESRRCAADGDDPSNSQHGHHATLMPPPTGKNSLKLASCRREAILVEQCPLHSRARHIIPEASDPQSTLETGLLGRDASLEPKHLCSRSALTATIASRAAIVQTNNAVKNRLDEERVLSVVCCACQMREHYQIPQDAVSRWLVECKHCGPTHYIGACLETEGNVYGASFGCQVE
jgi:hypothetical protein